MDTDVAPSKGDQLNQIRTGFDSFTLLAFFTPLLFFIPATERTVDRVRINNGQKTPIARVSYLRIVQEALNQRQQQGSPLFSAWDRRQQQSEMESKCMFRN
jgi:hypothetical protein